MRYIGSKISTREAIYDLFSEQKKDTTFCDPFGGIATMSSFFKEKGFKVYTSDLLTFANYFQRSKLKYNCYPSFKKLFLSLQINNHEDFLNYINSLSSNKGWFITEFSNERQFFTNENASKIEAIRNQIKQWDDNNLLDENEKAFLLSSLIDSMDKVANTAGTYYAYLKKWSEKALRTFTYKFIEPIKGKHEGNSYQIDALELIKKQHYNVIYLDPPYNSRSYSRYYHLPEVIARQIEPEVNGMAGIPSIELQKSAYNNKQSSITAFKELVDNAQFDTLLFHYTDSGLIEKDEILNILGKYGKITEFYIDCLGYSTKQKKRKDMHHIYMVTNEQNK